MTTQTTELDLNYQFVTWAMPKPNLNVTKLLFGDGVKAMPQKRDGGRCGTFPIDIFKYQLEKTKFKIVF